MSVPAAFLGVVLIWATTPLAIKWSSEGAGFLFGVASRMVLGVFVCLVLVALLSRRMRWHRNALHTYLAAGLGLWGAMTSVYWSAQFIPSGLISVLFGLSPVVTGVMAALWLGERVLTPFRLLGLGLGVAGLAVIFGYGLELGSSATLGLAGVLLSVHIHSASAVWVKRIGAGIPALETTTGALLVAVPLFLLDWAIFDGRWPVQLDPRSAWSILYLAVFGSALGFILYFYVLRRVQASRVALITLVTPVMALFLGQYANGELVGSRELIGTAVILSGLALYQWGDRVVAPARSRS
ncbi:MAG: DMT family transporter [Pseudomonadota bacterium]|nr:DMT family transporter [Pseudomonadota bacterium]